MEELKLLNNKDLLKLYKEYDELIHGKNPCYGIKDLLIFNEICREMDIREE